MRITTFLRSTLFICFIGISCTLSAQNSIGLFSKHTLNPKVRLINGDGSFTLHNQGVGIEYRRDWQTYHLFAFNIGYNTLPARTSGFGGNSSKEIFLQTRWRLFNPIVNMPRLKGFYSVGPSLFYFKESFQSSRFSTISRFDSQEWISGVDIQVGFNIDYDLCKRIKLIGYINPVSFVSTVSIMEVDNPAFTRSQNRDSVYDFDINLFSELRLGVMYEFANFWKKKS